MPSTSAESMNKYLLYMVNILKHASTISGTFYYIYLSTHLWNLKKQNYKNHNAKTKLKIFLKLCDYKNYQAINKI